MKSERCQVIRDIIQEENSDALFLESEFDKALIGTCLRYRRKTVAAYSSDACIKVLMKEHDCDDKEDNQPVFISDFRKIKLIELENYEPTDTIDKLLGTNGPV